jgi:hypothetical protein
MATPLFRTIGATPNQTGNSEYSPWPSLLYMVGNQDPAVNRGELLLSHRVDRAFLNHFEAVKEWLGYGTFGDSDGRAYHFLIALPDYRLRIAEIAAKDEEIEIRIETTKAIGGARCTVLAQTDNGRYEHRTKIVKGVARVPKPDRLETVHVYVTLPPDEIADSYRHSPYWITGTVRWLGPIRQASDVLLELAGGETDTVEFKPFIEPGHQKQFELVETAIAFANLHGGTILIGVDDHGAPDGVEKELHKLGQKKNLSDPFGWYEGHIKSVFSQAINKPLTISSQYVTVQGHTVLRVTVSGDDRPYATLVGNDIFIRRN